MIQESWKEKSNKKERQSRNFLLFRDPRRTSRRLEEARQKCSSPGGELLLARGHVRKRSWKTTFLPGRDKERTFLRLPVFFRAKSKEEDVAQIFVERLEKQSKCSGENSRRR